MVNLVQDVMTRKPKVLRGSSTVMDAARTMRDFKIGDVIVVDDTNRVRGIVTDRDLVVNSIASGSDPSKTTIGSFCTKDVSALKPTQTTDDAVKMMREKAIRRLPVVEGETLVGIVSLGDLAKRIDNGSCLGQISAAPPNN
jgi:signal-transduction protein with cAMP-binding, CBS, and nucleotidyltransferase domain